MPATIGAFDTSYLDYRTWANYYAGVAFAPNGEMLLTINDGAARVQRISGNAPQLVAREPGCPTSAGTVADSAGNVYLACRRAVLRISSEGAKSVLAGSFTAEPFGNADGTGAAARFSELSTIAIGRDGVLYVGDSVNRNVRKITSDGTVTTLAGSRDNAPRDGVGLAAGFNQIRGLAVDANGNVLVSDSSTIRRISPDGAVRTIAGAAVSGERDGPALSALFGAPAGLAFDSRGNLFIADTQNQTIRKLSVDDQVSTVAGHSASTRRRDGTGSEAGLYYPHELSIDSADNLYAIESHTAVRRITPAGVVTTPFALAQQSRTAGYTDGAAAEARFQEPSSVAADRAGNLYVADPHNRAVRKVSPSGVVSTLVRDVVVQQISAGQDGSLYALGVNNAGTARIEANGTLTPLQPPTYTDWVLNGAPATGSVTRFVDIVADRNGNRYELIEEALARPCQTRDCEPPYIRRILRRVGADGTLREWREADARTVGMAHFHASGLTLDADGNLYLFSDAIWKLSPAGAWSLVGGARQAVGVALAADSRGNVYALDQDQGATVSVRKIAANGAGSVLTGAAGAPLYKRPSGMSPAIAVDAADRLWITQGDALIQLAQ